MTQQNDTFSGTWQARHWYPSQDDASEDVSVNRMKAYQQGKDLVLESEANEEGSYLFIRLSIDGDLATGTWYESASPDGSFEGAQYSGAGQLLVSEDEQRMEGQWAGMGFDHSANKKRVYTGRWELTRTP